MSDERIPYTFTVLRYVHDITTEEFVNVGVVVHAPNAPFLGAKCTTRYSRSTDFFRKQVDGAQFRARMSFVEDRIEALRNRLETELPLHGGFRDALDAASRVIPIDSSALQWSAIGSGLTRDPAAELENLYARLVGFYEKPKQASKSDKEVWNTFQSAFVKRVPILPFQEKEFACRRFPLKFEHAWKNGQWNLYEPVSFDLIDEHGIFEKALKWVGRGKALEASREPVKMHFLVGWPTHRELSGAYDDARDILGSEVPGKPEVVAEEDAPRFADRFASALAAHQD